MPPTVSLLWFVGAGFFAVFLYKRRTGQRLTWMSGARLGWLSGLFTFVLVTVILTVIAMALSDPAGVAAIRDQWKAQQRSEQDLNQMIEIFRSPTGIAAGLVGSFVFLTSLPAFGGALCAKFFDRD
jgi:ABC-type phosphate transport system permease subunit